VAFELGRNFQTSLVATAPSPATSGTSLVVTAGEGTLFDTPPFNALVFPASAFPTAANAEVVRVTGKSTDTFTITRAQESSSARTVVVGDRIVVGPTAKTFSDLDGAIAIQVAAGVGNAIAVYRPVFTWPPVIVGAGVAQFSRRAPNLGAAPPVVVASGTANSNIVLFNADAATMNVSGRTTKLKLRLVVSTNATAPTINFLGRLTTLTGSQGAADSHNFSWGSTDVATATVTTPGASSVVVADSSAVDLPADGAYVPNISTSANMPATNPRALVQLMLLMAHV
jgi:hypothetical protein